MYCTQFCYSMNICLIYEENVRMHVLRSREHYDSAEHCGDCTCDSDIIIYMIWTLCLFNSNFVYSIKNKIIHCRDEKT